MKAEEATSEPEKEIMHAQKKVVDGSKQSFRMKVWEYLEKNKLVNFPRPAYGRIPNFKGAELAAAKLLELDAFKNAKSVEVNPDKPLEASRVLVLEHNKTLYVPIPRLQEGLLKKLHFCNEDKPDNLKQAVTQFGLERLGKSIDFGDGIHIDLLILGSVAVSRDGRRIGKGKGYADLEFAILKEMKAIDDNTVIVTTVHDSQVFDTLPEEIFTKFDVPVDYILTPTQVIKVEKKLARPQSIYWDLLSQRRISATPVLGKIKEACSRDGKELVLKAEDTDEESEGRRRGRKFSKRAKPKLPENGITASPDDQRPRRRRYFRRSRLNKDKASNNENEDPIDKENVKRRVKTPRRLARRPQVDFSLVVSNIEKNVRVRHLKDALIDHGIKPNNIVWLGYKGVCYLHYVNPAKKVEDKVVEEKAFAVDNVIEILQGLKLSPESTTNLSVKVMEPITRIETTDVTAV